MVFSSLVFVFLFLVLTLGIYYAVPFKFKNLVIFISGFIFYAWGEPKYVAVMLISTLIDYFAGLAIHKYNDNIVIKRIALIVSLVMNLSLLGIFKYSDFIFGSINSIFGLSIENPFLDITNNVFGAVFGAKPESYLPLPIGISFFTFQSMSYTIDMYLGKIKVQKNVISFTAFVNLFPQIVAGPIVRYDDVAAELDNRVINLDLIYEGIVRFITGAGKKVLIANGIGQLWNEAFALMGSEMSVLTAWLGIIGYTLQIYFDFSGYSDMAIGLGKMMGFNFPENFDYPYLSKSISEFWRRWHMTLGAWFRSYVYIPLGGNRCSKWRNVFNLAVVWLLTGIWHGASWNFILWGCLYGVFIIAEKLFLGKLLEKLPTAVRWLYTMLLVVLGWVLFVTPDLPTAFGYMGIMFGSTGVLADSAALYLLLNYGVMLVLGIFASTDAWKIIVEKVTDKAPAAVNIITPVAKIAVFILCIAYLADATYNPFLYFNF